MKKPSSASPEDEVFRATFKWAAGNVASERRGRHLTKEEQAYYDSFAEPALAVKKLVERILER